MTTNGAKLLALKKPILNGIFAVFKEKGDTVYDYKNWIRLTLYHETRVQFGSHRIREFVELMPKYCEPFASGVICVGSGHWSARLLPLTRFWDHEWIVSAKLGIQTESYSLESAVTNEMPFNHINEEMLINAFKTFIGSKEQSIPPFIKTGGPLIEEEEDSKVKPIETNRPTINRIRECRSIELISFDPPFFKLKVICDGSFWCRTLVHDLGIKLDSCAHVTDLHLDKMGPLCQSDCLKKHEIHLNNIYEAIEKYTPIILQDLKRFEHLKTPKRRNI